MIGAFPETPRAGLPARNSVAQPAQQLPLLLRAGHSKEPAKLKDVVPPGYRPRPLPSKLALACEALSLRDGQPGAPAPFW